MKKTNAAIMLRNEKGQGVLEYVILASLIGIFCLAAVKQFGSVINTRINHMRKTVVEQISTQ
ncbi:MAG: Flp family type IVb pilin [Halobacteriovorax sp.]|nr:Flp family type IVb pilin [Halobacteriovorax sp.]